MGSLKLLHNQPNNRVLGRQKMRCFTLFFAVGYARR